ncbi:Holliday junction resolvase RecU [Saliterribacillus persicus]|uniref:Holliday junction resolvase RecU n=1 Tax=Saliterribacillus persicus TaxID=930114 RepID=A0A368XCI9_9BACI|nr:Holliday junction resolvase RecU [Saliterribacillus persicus]RCW64946.1 recombination protein U [Saliterribacillus persicus]
MRYPNGKRKVANQGINSHPSSTHYSNRGMTLEQDINDTNEFYLISNRAVIHKKPTPVQIVQVDYPKRSAAVIKEAYFKQASTTDYNGVYRNRYIDFEAKETKNKLSFPLNNIHEHQINHMKQVAEHGGIAFLIVRFTAHQKTFYFPSIKLFEFCDDRDKGGRKSIPLKAFEESGYLIPMKYQARVDYLDIIDKICMKNGGTTHG